MIHGRNGITWWSKNRHFKWWLSNKFFLVQCVEQTNSVSKQCKKHPTFSEPESNQQVQLYNLGSHSTRVFLHLSRLSLWQVRKWLKRRNVITLPERGVTIPVISLTWQTRHVYEGVLTFPGLTCYEVACRVVKHTRGKRKVAFLLKEASLSVGL